MLRWARCSQRRQAVVASTATLSFSRALLFVRVNGIIGGPDAPPLPEGDQSQNNERKGSGEDQDVREKLNRSHNEYLWEGCYRTIGLVRNGPNYLEIALGRCLRRAFWALGLALAVPHECLPSPNTHASQAMSLSL